MTTASRTVTVGSTVGLHARPAMLFVQAVAASDHRVTVTKTSGESADGSSILSVLALAAGHGEEVTITADGDHAEAVAQQLADLVASNLDAS